jgi:hypothetical protein
MTKASTATRQRYWLLPLELWLSLLPSTCSANFVAKLTCESTFYRTKTSDTNCVPLPPVARQRIHVKRSQDEGFETMPSPDHKPRAGPNSRQLRYQRRSGQSSARI